MPKLNASAFSMPELNRQEILAAPHVRAVTERAELVDAEKRIIKLSFSSDAPIDHWFGTVTLNHADGCANLERLNTAAGFLLNHDANKKIGKVVRAWIENGKGYAEIKVSNNNLGNDFWRDYQDDCLIGTSFGFMINSFDDALSDYKNNQYVTCDWEPFEISDVSIPADISVGVGRSLEVENKLLELINIAATRGAQTENKMPETIENPVAQPTPAVVVNPAITRAAEFRAYGEAFGEVELALDMAADETKSFQDLGKAILAKRAANQAQIIPPAPASVAERNGQIELARSIPRMGNLKAFKGERAQENAYRVGMWFKAIFNRDAKAIEFCQRNGMEFRSQNSSQNESGGFLVPTEFDNTIIDLRILYGVFRANTNVVPMGSDTLIRPRRVSGLTAYFVADEAAITESSKGWDSVTLNAKELGVLAKYTQNVSDDAIISMADDLANEIAYAFANKEDECGFNGDGTSTYGGIVGLKTKFATATAGVQTAAGATYASVTLANLNSLIGLLPQFARRSGNLKFYCSHAVYANVLVRLAQSVGGTSYGDISGILSNQFFGIPVEIVEVMPSTGATGQICLYYGNLAMASTFGDRRGVTVDQTNSHDTDFAKRLMTIRGTERFDINVHDVGDASNAGALVALKLA